MVMRVWAHVKMTAATVAMVLVMAMTLLSVYDDNEDDDDDYDRNDIDNGSVALNLPIRFYS